MQTIKTQGNRAVVINQNEEKVWANVYVNARNGIANADITTIRWTGKSVAAANKWADKQLVGA